MSWFARKAEAVPPSVETSAPEAKDTSLRDTLRDKLKALAQEGNVQAIRELLDRPSLLEDQKPKLTSIEDVMAVMKAEHDESSRALVARSSRELVYEASCRCMNEIFEDVRNRHPELRTPKPTFESTIEARLGQEGNIHGLRAFRRMTDSERAMIWRDLSSELGLLGKELEASNVVVQ